MTGTAEIITDREEDGYGCCVWAPSCITGDFLLSVWIVGVYCCDGELRLYGWLRIQIAKSL
ncbi:hypothetical protein TSAR_000227 [Trichomalopsis sarcophagae]|uniref:Uncharacterized protein n=1 Tax=Trichomalopsis sarcophagae TaxID=543379 RepID=A0A232EPC1_9HYME|nr:hypothetical protein TSAR_000227 [Trichomalopsis sarcophagae]